MLHRKAFTLIELMIVMIIVAILAAAAVPIYSSLVSRAYEAEVLSALATVRTAQRAYYAENGAYPAAADPITGSVLMSNDPPYLSSTDFVDLQYVAVADVSVDGSGGSTWSGTISGYSYGTVTMAADGTTSRS